MKETERRLYLLLLGAAVFCTAVSMIAGPLDHTAVATGAAASAILIGLCLLVYGLWFWPRKR